MAVKLRLARYGGKKRPFYRVVATDERSRRDGRFLEQLGTFDPLKEPEEIKLKIDRVDYWLGVGAQPSHVVRDLVKKYRAAGIPTS